MKVFAALVVVIGTAAALGSGPYLPSGWRPSGPAFNLPSEPQPAPIDTLQGSEGASSDSLREYGPPKEVDARFGQNQAVEVATEVIDEAVSEVQVAKGRALNLEEENEAAAVEEEVSSLSDVTEAAEELKAIGGINNIADAIGQVENEGTQEVQIPQDLTELRSGVQSTGSAGLPEEFLEYGPPGFREYGLPKQNSVEGTGKDNVSTIEARRRRFSPKFRVARKQRSLRRRQHH